MTSSPKIQAGAHVLDLRPDECVIRPGLVELHRAVLNALARRCADLHADESRLRRDLRLAADILTEAAA